LAKRSWPGRLLAIIGAVQGAAGIHESGGSVVTLELPDPRSLADDEALIEVRAAGVGNWDEFVRRGQWDVGRTPPMALGVEAAGVVTAAGAAVGRFCPGDEVLTHPLPLRDQGAWAPRMIVAASLLARKPANVTFEAAAALPVPALTAERVVADALDVRADELILVNGGGGVTGALVVALAALRGAEVIATAGASNHQRLRRLGAAQVIDYHHASWQRDVLAIAGGAGVDAVANAVPGGSAKAIAAVRDGGRLATITSDPPPAQRGIEISSVYVRADGTQLERLAELLDAGAIELAVGRVFGLAEAATALRTAVAGNDGKAVVLAI
jgi:NADPH:quinone reductase-like Zn-dependent oxidoreductase